MTDTVNVPREVLERLVAWINREVPVPTRSATRWAMDITDLLAAAPKAEPVSDPYKMDRAEIIEAVKVAMNDAWCDITSDTGCWPADLHRTSERGPVRIEYRPAIWTETTAEMVANILAQPEAPKVEQEPTHKAAVIDAIEEAISKPIDDDGWTRQVAAETAYNYLLNGGHLQSHPATASDELLEALKRESWDLRSFNVPTGGGDYDIGWRVVGHWEAEPRERTIAEVFEDDPAAAIRAAIAKHKGPQS